MMEESDSKELATQRKPPPPPLPPQPSSPSPDTNTTTSSEDEFLDEEKQRQPKRKEDKTPSWLNKSNGDTSNDNGPPLKRIQTTTPRTVTTTTTTAPGGGPLHHQIPQSSPTNFGDGKLTSEDIEICQRLDEEYERALEEREIGYNARYASVRQSAFLSVFFMLAYLVLGTGFFAKQTAWTIPESLLFSIYTITTVGYGKSDIPTTPGFQSYTIFYILVGIAALTIMVCMSILIFFLIRFAYYR